jgi:uncharacterized membrane-anchored protein/uncharacterized membrane protein
MIRGEFRKMQVRYSDEGGSEKHEWTVFLSRLTLFLAVVLVGAAVVCGVAAKWQALSFFQRFAGLQTLLAVCALITAGAWLVERNTHNARQNIPPALLCAAALITGSLLALLWQHYQTGADAFTLFGFWALLILPWAIAARSRALWLLWALIVNVAVSVWLNEIGGLRWASRTDDDLWLAIPTLGGAAVLALLNVVLLAAWERAAGPTRSRVCQRVLALIGMAAATYAVVFGDDYSPASSTAAGQIWHILWRVSVFTNVLWGAITLGWGVYYSVRRPDRAILAIISAGFIAVSLRWAIESLFSSRFDLNMIPVLAVMLLAEAAIAARWLMRVGPAPQTPHAPATPLTNAFPAPTSAPADATVFADPAPPTPDSIPAHADQTAGAPWYVQTLLGFAAWLATGLLLVFMALSDMVRTPRAASLAAFILCALAVALVRAARGLFWRQVASALGFAGLLLAVYGFFDMWGPRNGAMGLGLLALAVYISAPDRLLRFLAGGVLAFALAVLLWFGNRPVAADDMFSLWTGDMNRTPWNLWLPTAFLTALIAAAAFLARPRLARVRSDALLPLAWAFALFSQTVIWRTAGVSVAAWPSLWHLTPPSAIILAATACLPAVAILCVLHPRRFVLSPPLVWGVPLALLVLALFWLPAPGIALALTWMFLGFGLGQNVLLSFGLISLLVYLSGYYYQLDVPLLEKALWLVGAAFMLAVMRGLVWLIPRITSKTAPAATTIERPSRFRNGRVAGVLVGLVLILGFLNVGAWQRERVLASGRVVLLALAPVDPRSLMQGDYMALNYEQTASAVRFKEGAQSATSDTNDSARGANPAEDAVRGMWPSALDDGYAILSVDGNDVGRISRIQSAVTPHAAEEIALRYRVRNGRLRFVSEVFFFPEGQASHYSAARYGEFRVGDDGTALLVGLCDADRKPL